MKIKDLLKIEKGIAYAISFFLLIPFSYTFYEPFIDIKRALSFPLILLLGFLFFSLKKKIRVTRPFIILFLFVVYISLSLLWTENKSLSFFSMTRYFSFLIILLIAQNSVVFKKSLFRGIFISSIFLAIYVLMQSFKIDPFDLGANVATIGNSNYLGLILLFFVSYFFFTFIETKKTKDLLFFMLFSIALVFGSRMKSAVLAFFAGLTTFSFYKKNKIFISIMIILMLIGIVLVIGEIMKGRASYLIRYYVGRDSIKGVLTSIKTTISGFGENSYMDSFNRFRSVDAFRIGGKSVYSITSHNIFIDIFFELGVIGLLIFLCYIFFVIKSLDIKIKIVFFTFLIGSQFIDPLKHISTSVIFFLPLMMIKRQNKYRLQKKYFFIFIMFFLFSLIMESSRLKNSIYAMDYYKNVNPSGTLSNYDSGMYLFEKANFYRRKEEYKRSEKAYVKCLKKLPDFIPALLNMGQLYYNLKQDEKALSCYEKVIGINPEHSDAWFFIGVLKYNMLQYKESVQSLEKAYIYSKKKDKDALELLLKIKSRKDDILDN